MTHKDELRSRVSDCIADLEHIHVKIGVLSDDTDGAAGRTIRSAHDKVTSAILQLGRLYERLER